MATASTADQVLEQLRSLTFEEREYVRAEIMREDFESGRVEDSPEERREILRRAQHAVDHPEEGVSPDHVIADMRAVVAAVRARRK